MTSELHSQVRTDRIGPDGLEIIVQANEAECDALARRMQLPAIRSLTCRFRLTRARNDVVHAVGQLCARVVQTCVITMEDFEAPVEEAFTLNFVPAGQESEQLDLEAEDEVPFANNTLDLGEAAAEQLGLALDPYPRQPGAELPEQDADDPANAFTAMLRRQPLH